MVPILAFCLIIGIGILMLAAATRNRKYDDSNKLDNILYS